MLSIRHICRVCSRLSVIARERYDVSDDKVTWNLIIEWRVYYVLANKIKNRYYYILCIFMLQERKSQYCICIGFLDVSYYVPTRKLDIPGKLEGNCITHVSTMAFSNLPLPCPQENRRFATVNWTRVMLNTLTTLCNHKRHTTKCVL